MDMPEYRFYLLGADDHIKGAENVECATDQDACLKARQMMRSHPSIEIWEGSRFVARIDAASKAAAD
jgi:hypothetical protein